MTKIHDTFGGRLHLQLNVVGITARQLSKLSGIAETTISHFITNSREPSLKNLRKILRVMPHADARWLIIGTIND